MKYVMIKLRDKREFSMLSEKVEALLDSDEQIIKISDDNGNWTGETINKSEILRTEPDYQREKAERINEENKSLLEEGKVSKEEIAKLLEKYKPDFLK